MLFANKQKKLEVKLDTYIEKAELCVAEFQKHFKEYCKSGDLEQLRQSVSEIHKAESEADDIRREIEVLMYSKALFPESRGDVLGLLEALDRVPNAAEAVVRLIVNQYVKIPAELHGKLFQLVDVCYRCVSELLRAVSMVFTNYTNAITLVGNIDELESQADGIEADLLQQIFSSEMRDLDKILLRDLVESISLISDRSENVGDRIRIIVAKRMV